ncbi:MAG: fibronectin type III domain-containing protein, partial [Methylococcales bacterium]|nr:fibronectin type III domain-containing protein [Methylococcales bacterium]
MRTLRFLALTLTLLTVNVAFAANEIHWTVTGPNSVTFDWRGTTAEKTIGYGLTSGAYTTVTATTPNPVPVSSKGPFWEAKLTGLTANTRYYYKIGTMPERSFRTPPTPGSSNFNIYAQGNIGSSSTYFNTGAVQDLIANDLPSFVVGLGDLTLGTLDGRAAVDQHFNDIMVWSKEAAYMPVWGDMDTVSSTNDNFKNYKGRFAVPNPQTSPGSPLAGGEDWYWFDYGNVRFITLPEPWTGAWADWKTKADALMAEAQTNPNIKFIVTFVHRAAYSSAHYAGLSSLKDILDSFGDTYSKYKLNVNAHSNNYERTIPLHGVTHVTAGTGGADLDQDGTCLWLTCTKPDWSAFRAMHHGALKLHFTSSSIEGSFICGSATDDAINEVNCTEGSVVDKFVIGGPVISAVSALSITQDGAKISWTLDQPATGQVEYGTTASYGQMSTKATSFNYTTHIHQLSGLAPATLYHFRVRSANQAGLESVSGDFTFATTAAMDTTAPSVPAYLTATAISSTQINLSWGASTDNVGVTGYKVFRNGTQIATVTGTSYSDTGLAASTVYSYTVLSYDAAGNSSSNSVSVSAKTAPITAALLPDVIVTSVSYANGIFTSTVKNQGTVATSTGVAIGVAYSVDGVQHTWGGVNGPLAAGASVTIGSDGGPYTIP